ncbi:MAG TPA: glycosyltransferase family A protein [Devosiaceae bacterium]|nr:glycosyltransferase family A protein [Devosiaceae bacterium]
MAGEQDLYLSVIVPVYNQWHLLPDLVAHIREQSCPKERFELIVVDNGSSERSGGELNLPNARVVECLIPGSYAARNHGASLARGDWLVFTDADCLPDRDWLASIHSEIGRIGDTPTLLAGAVEMRASSADPGLFEIYDLVKGIPQARYVKRGYAATANLSVPRAVFERLGGFDAARFSGGDADFCRRAGAAGCPIRYLGAARVGHPARSSWTEVVTKARRVKGGQLRAGSPRRRLAWAARTMMPPLRGAWHFLRADQPMSFRLRAIFVLCLIWLVEMGELVRLVGGARPERR